MNVEVILVNAFTSDGLGGNPAGVVLNADQLSNAQKLQIAQAVGYSETAFVCHDDEAAFEISFFTTTGEVDFCGHATLAVFSTLFALGRIGPGEQVQRTKAGLLPVQIAADGRVVMGLQLPQKLGRFSNQEIAAVIGIESALLDSTRLPIEVISTGLADLIIPIPHGHLDSIRPNDRLIAQFCQQHNLVGFHLFELSSANSPYTASCRNFAPLVGISEESATGSASGALACYLAEYLVGNTRHFIFEQGRAMNCASTLHAAVELDNTNIVQVRVGGMATQTGTLSVSV